MKQRLTVVDQVSLSNALYAAANLADQDAKEFATHQTPSQQLVDQFTAQAAAYRALAERIDEAGAIILSDE